MNEIDEYLKGNAGETGNQGVEPSTVAQVGDFVNYSVTVDGVTYDQWRILHFNTNGQMEIVCYNGPDFTLGGSNDSDETKSKGKTDYANAIKILNDASQPYKNGTYGESARHLGSNPTNPSSYETISEEYVKFYSDYDSTTDKPATNLEYLEQTHHETDINALKMFSGSEKMSADYSWLASRDVSANSSYSNFRVRRVYASGGLDDYYYLCYVYAGGSQDAYSYSYALAPVVSLKSGIKIIPGSKDTSEDGKWTLTEQ